MATHRYQVTFGADGGLPRDLFVTSFYLNHTAGEVGQDLQTICDDACAVFDGTLLNQTGAREVRVTAYDVGPAPNFPLATSVLHANSYPESIVPRELALCLSYKADGQPAARRRGRMYIPAPLFMTTATIGKRPTLTHQQLLLSVADGLAGLGGIDVDWSVYSHVDAAAFAVSSAWVDDEWDIQRRRGLKPTGRQSKAYGE